MIESIGHYRILDKIGSGAMGDLYRARDTQLGRTVALRVVTPAIADDADLLADFFNDARASATVSHPNIAALYEIGEDGGLHYLACEFVAGQKLKHLIAGRPLNPRRALDLTVQIADALADGYANDIVHGCLSADTIVINAKGNAKLLDFGLAQWTAAGKWQKPPRGHEGDIAALGALLHEMLTGEAPLGASAPSELDAHVPKELDSIIHRMRSTSDDEQYHASATLAADLRSVAAILDRRAQAANEVVVGPPKGARRRKAIFWAAAMATMAALAWLLWTVSKIN